MQFFPLAGHRAFAGAARASDNSIPTQDKFMSNCREKINVKSEQSSLLIRGTEDSAKRSYLILN